MIKLTSYEFVHSFPIINFLAAFATIKRRSDRCFFAYTNFLFNRKEHKGNAEGRKDFAYSLRTT